MSQPESATDVDAEAGGVREQAEKPARRGNLLRRRHHRVGVVEVGGRDPGAREDLRGRDAALVRRPHTTPASNRPGRRRSGDHFVDAMSQTPNCVSDTPIPDAVLSPILLTHGGTSAAAEYLDDDARRHHGRVRRHRRLPRACSRTRHHPIPLRRKTLRGVDAPRLRRPRAAPSPAQIRQVQRVRTDPRRGRYQPVDRRR